MIDFPASDRGALKGYGVRELLNIFARRKLLILIPTTLTLTIAWLIVSTLPPRYTAEAMVALDARKIQIVEIEVVSRLPQENATLRTELDVIASRSIAEQVVDLLRLATDADVLRQARGYDPLWQRVGALIQFQIAKAFDAVGWSASAGQDESVTSATRLDVVNWLLGNLKVSNDGRSFTIIVSFTSEDPEESARIANAIAETYLDDQIKMKVAATTKANEWLGERLVGTRKELQAAEAAVDEYRRASGLVEAKGGTMYAQRLSELNNQLISAQSERARAEAKLEAAKERNFNNLTSPSLQLLQKQRAELDFQIAEAKDGTLYTRRFVLPSLEMRAASLERQIDFEAKALIAALSNEVDAVRKTETGLAAVVKRLEAESETSLHLTQLQREADANRTIYETFLNRYKQTIEQQGLATPDARLLSRANSVGSPVSSKKLPILLLGGLGGIVVGVALALLRETLDPRIRQISKVEENTGIPVFGMLPRMSRWKRLEPQDYLVKSPGSPFSTALRQIQVSLRLSRSAGQNQVFLFTSAQAGEGKTSFCISLARSLAKSGAMRVLVIDVDPRRSSLASRFGGAATPNLGQLAETHVELADLVQKDTKSSTHFIAAAHEDDSQRILYSERFADLIADARRTYDLIVLDAPPILAGPDTALASRFADATLFIVQWGRTSWEMMMSALRFLKLCGINVEGIIISHVAIRDTYYGRIRAEHLVSIAAPSR